MRHIAEETVSCGEPLVHFSNDICGPCSPWHPWHIAEGISDHGKHIVTLSSMLPELLKHKGLLEFLNPRGV